MSFVSELKRRNVFRAAFAYAVVWWLLVQIAGLLLDAFSAPDWIFKSLIILLAIGFPVALILAWFFELTTDGLIKSADLAQHEAELRTFRRYLNPIIISMLSAAVILFTLDKIGWIGSPLKGGFSEHVEPGTVQYSLAVLPFTNRSGLAENAYFVDGIHDDLLTMLAKINSLSVTSRTSVMRYHDSKKSIPEISSELGVNYILEGAVQRDGDQVRVNAQLIDTRRDDHLWAETFDRELSTASLFTIQSNIARAIADALNAELSNADKSLLENIPTDSLAAYDAYLLGKHSLMGNSIEAYEAALAYFDEALSQDDYFAGAYAGLCEAQLGLYSKRGDISHFEAAELACDQALAIDANLTEAHIAKGSLFRNHGDYQLAESAQRKALEAEPKNVDAMVELGLTLAELGRIREAETILLKAELLQPDHWYVQDVLQLFYISYDDHPDRYERSVKHAMRVVELSPKNAAAWNNLGTAYHSLQQYDAAKVAWDSALQLEPTRTGYTNRGLQYYYEGQYADSAEMQKKAIGLAPSDDRAWGRLGDSYRAMGGNEALAKEAYITAIPLAETRLEINNQDWRTRAMLAIYFVYAGREEDALQQIETALSASDRDAEVLLYAALIFHAVGDEEATLLSLEEMLVADESFRIYAAEEPDFKNLRGNERFDRLINP
ncbi:MAG: tetratricopeptide repeat protein [Xanthomonadales bacterium]|nr:tetratricopeptide repeat protein [Xanthomonadales bacterium]